MVIEQEKQFIANIGDDGSMTFVIRAREDEPTSPKMLYSGTDHALLVRNTNSTVILDYLSDELKPLLVSGTQVNIVEMRVPEMQEIARSYAVTITRMANLPHLPEDMVTPEDFEKEMENAIASLSPEEIADAEADKSFDSVL